MDAIPWKGALGHALRTELAAAVPTLPQLEPTFDLLHTPPSGLNEVLKRSALLCFVFVENSTSGENKRLRSLFATFLNRRPPSNRTQVHFFRNLYANPQHVALIVLKEYQNTENPFQNMGLRDRFERIEQAQLRREIALISNDTLRKSLQASHGLQLRVPRQYTLVKTSARFAWMRYMDAEQDKNIFIHKESYTDTSAFSNISGYRARIAQDYLCDSQKPWIYMRAQSEIPFQSKIYNLHGCYTLRTQGLWKLSDHSIGGPFVSYLLPTKSGNLYYLEAFLYRAGGKKRDALRAMEAILQTVDTPCISMLK